MSRAWTVETVGTIVDDEIEALPVDIRARLSRCVAQIEAHGPSALTPKAFKHLGDGLWELRLQGRDGIARAIYVTASERRLVIVRAFIKKTLKTPPRELAVARERARLIP